MKRLFTLCFSILFLQVSAQEKATLSGYIKDKSNGEVLIAASVYFTELATGTVSNAYGFYSVTVPKGKYTLVINYLGFQADTIALDLGVNVVRNFSLAPQNQQLNEVVIKGEKEDKNVTSTEIGVNRIDAREIKKITVLMGESDVLKAIQMLPGISSVGEGASGFNVRGGNIDQNLILLDEAPIYNSSHLFGFFSIFNSDAIKDTKIYKGGIPANYGGRLSSVLDVRQRDGNKTKFEGQGGIGAISSRLTLEGPLKKNKGSFLVSGRRSYVDLFFPLFPSDAGIGNSKFFFYDFNTKLNYEINDKNRVYLSGYFGNDVFDIQNQFGFTWGNQTASARWNHLFSNKLFSNFTAVYSNYNYKIGSSFFEWKSNIKNYTLKYDFGYFLNPKNTISFGAQSGLYRFSPGEIKSDFFGEDQNLAKKNSSDLAIYAMNEQKISGRLSANYGLRISNFNFLGPYTIKEYKAGEYPTVSSQISEKTYSSNKIIKSYFGLEPRASATYILNDESSLKMGYNRMFQYIHLISNTTAAVPTDIYAPSDPFIPPAIANQISTGYFRNINNNEWETSAEIYYKTFKDVPDFKDGANLIGQENLETEIRIGNGRAYGAEFYFKRNKGKVTGWVSYTLSKSERKTPTINNGNFYPANFDKRHILSVFALWQINKKWDMSGNFSYQTGRPFTPAIGRYMYHGLVIPNYGERNSFRMQDYHRLDLSFNYDKNKANAKLKSSWSFGVYNAYGRRNTYSIFFRSNPDNPQETQAVRLAILAAPIPYVTWNFKF